MTAEKQDDAAKLWAEVAAERENAPSETELTAETPVTEAETETTAEAEVQAEAATEQEQPKQEEDPYAGLSPVVRERLSRLEQVEQQLQLIPSLQQSLKTAEGRVNAMQRELDKAKEAAKTVAEAPTAKQIAAASKSLEKWDSLKADFPEWATATQEFVEAQIAGIKLPEAQEVPKGLTPEEAEALVQQRLQAFEAHVEKTKIADKYPTWTADVKTAEFKQWRAAQTAEVQALGASPLARDAIRMLDLFHAAKAAPAPTVQKQRESRLAAAVSTKPGFVATTAKSPSDMSPAELWEHERKLAAKRRSSHGLTY